MQAPCWTAGVRFRCTAESRKSGFIQTYCIDPSVDARKSRWLVPNNRNPSSIFQKQGITLQQSVLQECSSPAVSIQSSQNELYRIKWAYNPQPDLLGCQCLNLR